MSSIPSTSAPAHLLAPMALTLFFAATLAVYSLLPAHARALDPDVTARPASRLLGRYLRHYFVWLLHPVEHAAARAGISPTTITVFSLLASAVAGGLLAAGHFAAGGWMYLAAGILDVLDGRVARATGKSSRAGAFLDSVTDRYVETVIFAGLAWYYREGPALAAVLLAASGSLLVSYVRARGESLGVDVRVGTMQRPERLVWLGAILVHAPLLEALFTRVLPSGAWPTQTSGAPIYPPVVAALLLIGLSAHWTAAVRVRHTMRRLDEVRPAQPAPVHLGGSSRPSLDQQS